MQRDGALSSTPAPFPDGTAVRAAPAVLPIISARRWDPAVGALALLTCAATLAINAYPIIRPLVFGDDYEILVRAWTWERTWKTLWEPQNEHAMPLGRLSTWLLARLAGRPSVLPLLTALQGPLALLAALGLVFLFACREMGHALYGVAAMALFGVSSAYAQAVYWFSASFALPALVMLLLALLAAQRWRQTGRIVWLVCCAVGVALSPCWFALGILAGPLCCLYLLPGFACDGLRPAAKHFLAALVPLLGSVVFLAVSLPRTKDYIDHLDHYGGKSPLESFKPSIGALNTCRAIVDNLVLGVTGVSGLVCPLWLLPFALVLLAVAGIWWWRHAPCRRLLVLGLGFIFGSYLLIHSARADWYYEAVGMTLPHWGRYQLFPQLGLALFISGGLPTVRLFQADEKLTRTQFRWLAVGVVVLFLIQLPRGLLQHPDRAEGMLEQQEFLREIESMDARCRQHGIDAATARAALPRLKIWGNDKENGWDFLRGSDQPRAVTVEEARQLLTDE